ncbi:hypothetical protein [Lactococcus garvieae]|uniref:hypothetical protein n=1 Tax=Lactococcus garvieae TaxID=1363 RepID=UPI0002F66CE9|nr:hypothetical protein [Lactococcus garvieae]
MKLIRQLVISDTGFTLSDILDNDFSSVLDIIQDKKEEVKRMSLEDFMNTL